MPRFPRAKIKRLRVIIDTEGAVQIATGLPPDEEGWWEAAANHARKLTTIEPATGVQKIATLGAVHRNTTWMWVHCKNVDCLARAPIALAPLVIRWGKDAPFEWLRQRAVCEVCGHRGVETMRPSWVNTQAEWQPFPIFDPGEPVCNLYSMTKSQDAIRQLRRAMRDNTGNLPPLPGIYPDQMAPVIRNTAEGEEMQMMRWGFPPPPNMGGRPITNVRNTNSSFWLKWLNKPEHRCLVPVTSFCEWTDSAPKTTKWFALSEERPLFYFAGIWRNWSGTRGTKAKPVEGEHIVYSFLTTEANADVAPIHAKAMPVILHTESECERWLQEAWQWASKLQRPLPDGLLKIVASGPKEDDSAREQISS